MTASLKAGVCAWGKITLKAGALAMHAHMLPELLGCALLDRRTANCTAQCTAGKAACTACMKAFDSRRKSLLGDSWLQGALSDISSPRSAA